MVNDAFGRQFTAYAGIPIAVIEEDKDGNRDSALHRTGLDNGDKTTCTVDLCRALRSGGIRVRAPSRDHGRAGSRLQRNPVLPTLIEWLCGLGVFHPKAAARLRGIKNA